ncbi:MAG: DUF397 domain-containing protein [Pseudonocardiaceae bacterium]
MIHQDLVVRAGWRKSSFSGSGGAGAGNCVEVAPLADGTIALRDSKHPEAAVLRFTRTELHAWITSCKAGEFDAVS